MSFNAVEYLTKLVNDSAADEHHDMTTEEAISWIEGQGLRYEYEERAAILEFDGGLSREEADKQAINEIMARMDKLE